MYSGCPRLGRVAFALLALWAALYAAASLTGLGPLAFMAGRWSHVGMLLAVTGLCAARAVLVEEERRGWALVAAAMLSWTLGEAYFTARFWGDPSPPVPSLADVGYLGVYPFALAGIVVLVRPRMRLASNTVWLDAITSALVITALAAAVVLGSVLDSLGGWSLSVATNLAYPVGDMLLLGLVVFGGAIGGWRSDRRGALLAAGIACFWAGDSIYLVANASEAVAANEVADVVGWVGFALVALGAWQAPASRPPLEAPESARTIAAPIAFAGIGLALLVVGDVVRVNILAVALAAAALAAVLVRLWLTFRARLQLLEQTRAEAATDPLTGLRNRRAMIEDLAGRTAAEEGHDSRLAVFDLDGFKQYNDLLGHPAGDALLVRLSARLRDVVQGAGTAYRMGGDEFCVLIDRQGAEADRLTAAACAALSEYSDPPIAPSQGAVDVPREATSVGEALSLADERMYADKRARQRAGYGRRHGDRPAGWRDAPERPSGRRGSVPPNGGQAAPLARRVSRSAR